MVVRLVEIHQRHKVIQISLVLDVEYLIFVVVHLIRISKLREFVEKVITLFLLDLEFSILDVEVENSPHIIWLQFWNQLILAISGYIRNITIVTPEKSENLGYLGLDVRYLLSKLLVTRNTQRLNYDVEDPLCLLLDLARRWIESVTNFNLELFRNILFSNLNILSRSKEIIDILRHELILERLLMQILISCGRLTSLLKYLLFDKSLLINLLLLDRRAINLLIIRFHSHSPSNLFEFSRPALIFIYKL